MTVNSLANFGVPGLNGDRSAQLQPMMSHKFRALFFNFGTPGEVAPYDLTRQVRRAAQPNLVFNIATLYSYVSTVYIATRGEWQEMTLVFVDDIENTVAERVEEQVAKQQNFFDQTSSRAGENYKFEMDLDLLAGGQSAGDTAGDPNILRKWCFAGCWILNKNYNELSTEEANPMEITLTIRYDNVIGFNQDGFRMGVFSHSEEVESQSGVASTGVGAQGSISTNRATVSVGVAGSTTVGGVTIAGSGTVTF